SAGRDRAHRGTGAASRHGERELLMRLHGLVFAAASLGGIAACNVPLERFHHPDGPDGPSEDGSVEGLPDPLLPQVYVKASNTGVGDCFGRAVALSSDGSTLAVGAYREASAASGIGADPSDNSAPDAGAVYVLTRNGATWSQQVY